MKTLLIIFFIPISCIGQSILTGNYCTPVNLSGKCIQILEGNKFKYTDWGCFGSEAGEGNYAISKDTLKLVFSLTKDDTDELKIVSKSSHYSDSVGISFLIEEINQFKTGQKNGGIEYYRIIKATRNSIILSIIDKSDKENPVIFDLTNE